MKNSYLITIDLGTSSTKTVLWHVDGTVLAKKTISYNIDRPYSTWAEINPEIWWNAVCVSISQILNEGNISATDVAGIAVDGIGWTMVSIDQAGKVIFPALIWQDRRGENEAKWIKSRPDANNIINLSANPIDAAYITPKLLWLKENNKKIFNETTSFLTSTGFIIFKLTGKKICDYTQAYGYHFYDIRRKCWNDEAASLIGIPLEKIPPLCSPLDIIGEILPDAAKQIGLKQGIPVLAGGLDASVGALGAGVLSCGQTADQGGQAGGMILSVDKVIIEPRLIFGNHILPGQYLLQSGTVGGASLGWLKDILNINNDIDTGFSNPFEYFSNRAVKSPPGSNGLIFLPYMAGERTPVWNSDVKGALFGLSYKTNRNDISRSIMEGCAFAVYHNLLIALENGVSVNEWLGDGGAAESDIWCQIKSDVSNRPFIVRTKKDGTQGGHTLGLFAMLTYALGIYPNITNTVNQLLPQRRVYEPIPQNHSLYKEIFHTYLSLSSFSVKEGKKNSKRLKEQ